MKTLYFYSDINQTTASTSFRAVLQAASLSFTELVLGRDFRKHSTVYPGIEAVIDIDGVVYQEISNATQVQAALNAAPSSLPAPAPVIALSSPISATRAQTLLRKGEGNLSQQDRDALLIYLASKNVP